MFGVGFNKIEKLQKVVSLLKDLILGVTVVITCVIVYLGGDPSKLNSLDWLKLVGAAGLIVLGPIIGFLLYKLFIRIIDALLRFFMSIKFSDFSLWDDSHPWNNLLVSAFMQQEAKFWQAYNTQVKAAKSKGVKALLRALKVIFYYKKGERVFQPYLIAFSILAIAILVFRRTIRVYIP